MTLTIDLPDEAIKALTVKARDRGISAEQYARQVLTRDLVAGAAGPWPPMSDIHAGNPGRYARRCPGWIASRRRQPS